MKLQDLIGWGGLVLLILAVTFNGVVQRQIWLASAILLLVYCTIRKDIVNMIVNYWIIMVNLYFLMIR